MSKKKHRRKNWAAKELQDPKYRAKVEDGGRGKRPYKREHRNLRELLDDEDIV